MARASTVRVGDDLTEYKVVDRMGYSHSVGKYAVEVELPNGELRIATSSRSRGPWEWNRPVLMLTDRSGIERDQADLRNQVR